MRAITGALYTIDTHLPWLGHIYTIQLHRQSSVRQTRAPYARALRLHFQGAVHRQHYRMAFTFGIHYGYSWAGDVGHIV